MIIMSKYRESLLVIEMLSFLRGCILYLAGEVYTDVTQVWRDLKLNGEFFVVLKFEAVKVFRHRYLVNIIISGDYHLDIFY